MPMKIVIDKVSEWKGRMIAYGGGSGVSAYSTKAAAKSSELPSAAHHASDILSTYILPGVTLGSAISILGILVVVSRFVFDVWKYFDQRRINSAERQEGSQCNQ